MRVPWPGRPGAGKWFWLNLSSPLSNAIQDSRAACSGAVLMAYLEKEAMRGATAPDAVAHSLGNWAPVQVDDVGMIETSCEAGSARRVR